MKYFEYGKDNQELVVMLHGGGEFCDYFITGDREDIDHAGQL